MKLKVSRTIAVAVTASLAWSVAPSSAANPAAGQAKAGPERSIARPSPPAASEDARDLDGVWQRYPLPWPTYLADFDDVPPPDQGPDLEEPYATQWREQQLKRRRLAESGTPLVDPSTLCRPEGTPAVMQAIYPIQILQTPGQITVLAELFMQTRRIYMDVPMPPLDEIMPGYFGFSSGRWEGDTLVVKTQGIRTDVQFFEIPHSEAMTITERYRLAENGKLYLDISIEDPGYLRTPYEFRWIYERVPGYRIPEYVCDNLHDVLNEDGTVELMTTDAGSADEDAAQ